MAEAKTHLERARAAAERVIGEAASDGERDAIAQSTFPSELVEAARKIAHSDGYWTQDAWNEALGDLEAALDLYPTEQEAL